MRYSLPTALLVIGAAIPLTGQGPWVGPQLPCDIKPGHFRLNSAPINFKAAYEKPNQRDRMLAQTLDVVTRAILQDKQDQNPAAWYYLGRYYVEVGDPSGADSAFDRAERLAPQCAADIDKYRRTLHADVQSVAQRTQQEGKVDSAAVLYRAAAELLPQEPRPLFLLGAMYAARDQVDSAAKYLRAAAARSARDTAYADARREALSQVARLYFRTAQTDAAVQRWARTRFSRDSLQRIIAADSTVLAQLEANSAARRARGGRLSPSDQQGFARDSAGRAQALAVGRAARGTLADRASADSTAAQPGLAPALTAAREYVLAVPDDPEGVGALAYLYAQSGRTVEAAAMLDSTYGAGSTVAGEAVVEAGRRVVRAGLAQVGARVLARGLTLAPADRDAWADLANAYRILRDADGMRLAGRQLVAVDPLNRTSARILGTAWELAGQPDSARFWQGVADTITVEVSVASFVPGEGGFHLTGIAANSASTPSLPFRLTFEFLDAAGTVLTAQTVSIPAIAAQATHQFDLKVAGTAARGWRYRPS